jgi:AraC-like DNA-binding protein
VQFNTMSTINKASEGRGLEVYQFLKSVGISSLSYFSKSFKQQFGILPKDVVRK